MGLVACICFITYTANTQNSVLPGFWLRENIGSLSGDGCCFRFFMVKGVKVMLTQTRQFQRGVVSCNPGESLFDTGFTSVNNPTRMLCRR